MNQHLQKTIDKARAELERLGVDTHDVTDHALLEAFEKLAEGLGNVGLSLGGAVRAMMLKLRRGLEVYAAVLRWNEALRHGSPEEITATATHLVKLGVKTDEMERLRLARPSEEGLK